MILCDDSAMEGALQNQDFSIRPATEDDLSKIVAIENEIHSAPWALENFQSELSKPYSQFLLITDDESDEVVASYIVFWVMFDECQILNLGVVPSFRRKGFAKKLVMQAIRMAVEKGIRKILLDVRKSNLPAIQLYQSMRFVITHVRKGFYSNGEDAYQMALYLEGDGVDF